MLPTRRRRRIADWRHDVPLTRRRGRAVHKSDSTWELITQNTNFFNALFDSSRSLCPA